MIGAGTYDKEHDVVHGMVAQPDNSTSSILIVLEGKNGQGMSVKCHEKHLRMLPGLLRTVADLIQPELEQDLKQIAKMKGEPHAESATETDGGQSFAG